VRGWGGSVHSIPFLFQRSTTETLAKVRAAG
jgi:bifunctional ADP-heptose synthase (sugar kinase/adenylyltransferase)